MCPAPSSIPRSPLGPASPSWTASHAFAPTRRPGLDLGSVAGNRYSGWQVRRVLRGTLRDRVRRPAAGRGSSVEAGASRLHVVISTQGRYGASPTGPSCSASPRLRGFPCKPAAASATSVTAVELPRGRRLHVWCRTVAVEHPELLARTIHAGPGRFWSVSTTGRWSPPRRRRPKR